MPEKRTKLDMNAMREGASLGSVGLEMGLSVAIGYVVGYYLDKWLGTGPVMTIIWTFFGFGAAVKAVWVAYQRAKKVGEEPRPED